MPSLCQSVSDSVDPHPDRRISPVLTCSGSDDDSRIGHFSQFPIHSALPGPGSRDNRHHGTLWRGTCRVAWRDGAVWGPPASTLREAYQNRTHRDGRGTRSPALDGVVAVNEDVDHEPFRRLAGMPVEGPACCIPAVPRPRNTKNGGEPPPRSCRHTTGMMIVKLGPRPLTTGARLLFRFLWVALPSTRSRCSQFVFLRSTFVMVLSSSSCASGSVRPGWPRPPLQRWRR